MTFQTKMQFSFTFSYIHTLDRQGEAEDWLVNQWPVAVRTNS
ncbi:MAG: hypothetical protein ACI82A_004099 [Candidatus Azotimanducaceae bacterium]|jgi:hypothetical protein